MPALGTFTGIFIPAIEQELHRHVDHALSAETDELRQMLAYHLGWEGEGSGLAAQGKRIRPLLVLLTTAALGGTWQNALPAAAAVELVHNFSLIHDDIQDQSPLRRGRPTLWVKWNTAQAINAGDTMFSLAQLAMLNLQKLNSIQVAWHASQLLNQTCVALTQGQYLDLAYESRPAITIDDYWPMINGKTAALLSACTELGALISGAAPEIQSASRDFGRNLGLAFQVQDDLLGIWGETGQIGKSNESDLVSGKKTLPVLYGLSRQGSFARRWQAGPIVPADVPELVALLTEDGALAFTRSKADELTRQALEDLQRSILTPGEAGTALVELAHTLLQRQS